MNLFQECSLPQGGRAILLSVKPKYANLIASGQKRVEFRRTWATEEVGVIAIYASSPIQRIIALVGIDSVVYASPKKLWSHCVSKGGALTYTEFTDYFDGKTDGYALLLGEVQVLKNPVDPSQSFTDFSPPQSFRYLTRDEFKSLGKRVTVEVDRA